MRKEERGKARKETRKERGKNAEEMRKKCEELWSLVQNAPAC